MESKTVMLVNTVLMTTFICEDINGTFIAFGGDVTFWKQKKFWYFTDNHITVILTIYRISRYQKKRRDCVFFFPNLEHCLNFVCFREIFAGFDIDESYNYIQRDT